MVEIKTLKGGLRVAMEKLPYVQSASVGIWVKAGAVNETKINAGISHFIEHMMFKGSEKRSAKKIAEDVDNIGGNINAFTGKEATCYYIKTITDNIEKGAEILFDMFVNAAFDEKELKKERNVIFEEMKMIEDSPDDIGADLICEKVMKGNLLANRIIGSRTSLKGINSDTMKNYVREEYTKDSIVISVAGNFDEKRICEMIEEAFENFKETKENKIYELLDYKPSKLSKKRDIEQSHLFLATPTISLADDDYYSMAIISNIMGGSMSSRLFQSIREERGLAYSVYSGNQSYRYTGFFQIYAGIGHDKLQQTEAEIKNQLEILGEKGITNEELQKAKEQLKSSVVFGQESVDRRMYAMGKNLLMLNKIEDGKEIIDSLNAVSMEDMEKVISYISDYKKYSRVLISGN